MQFPPPSSAESPACEIASDILQRLEGRGRERTFSKDEPIPTRSGLLYWVKQGAICLIGNVQAGGTNFNKDRLTKLPTQISKGKKVFLGFVGAAHPFEVVTVGNYLIEAHAQVDSTSVIWMYWEELDKGSPLRETVLERFRDQHQRKLLWLSLLGQKRAIDRLLSFLWLLVEEYGEATEQGYCLPYPLTHAQIGSLIGVTRVTVTRLMTRLRERGLIELGEENVICLSPALREPL
jgi:CRP-like cAMP-binding protein